MIFKTCPYCGANLDPEEICDCLQGGYKYNNGSTKNIYRFDMNSLLDPAPGLEKEEYFGPGNKEHWNL